MLGRATLPLRFALAWGAASVGPAAFCAAQPAAQLALPGRIAEVLAEPPGELIVTVYRAPFRSSGSIELDDLNGFALISETRTVALPAGLSRVRFEGVADGIEPTSAIITGLPGTVIEKNRDARLLSPAALLAAAVGKPVELLRTRRNGKTERLPGTLLSDADGVVFQTAQGIEALRCAGLPETFSFEPAADLSARPTLSVELRTPSATTQRVTLSYLARGFDWAANYTATLSVDGQTMDLGAWVTLANANGVGFPSAHVQVVAGKLNREDGQVDPIDIGGPIVAQCWPRGSTSDMPMELRIDRSMRFDLKGAPAARAASLQEISASGAKKVQEEQLGDLKLYRVPERTTLASRQSKQVRLMDHAAIPISTVYGVDVAQGAAANDAITAPAHQWLRTANTTANHLGLPLPAGSVAVFGRHAGTSLLQHESGMRDTASGEQVEIDMGASADVQVTLVKESRGDSAQVPAPPLVPGVSPRSVKINEITRVQISNARSNDIQFELRLQLPQGGRLVRADHAMSAKNGRPLILVKVPANDTVTVRYQIDGPMSRAPDKLVSLLW